MRPGNPVTSARVDSCPAATTHNVVSPIYRDVPARYAGSLAEWCENCASSVRSVPSALKFSFMVWKIVLLAGNYERFGAPTRGAFAAVAWTNYAPSGFECLGSPAAQLHYSRAGNNILRSRGRYVVASLASVVEPYPIISLANCFHACRIA